MKVRFSLLIGSPPMFKVVGSPDVFRMKERAQQGVCEEAPIGSWASSKACTFLCCQLYKSQSSQGQCFLPEQDGQVMVHSGRIPIEQIWFVSDWCTDAFVSSQCYLNAMGLLGPVLKPS